MEKSNDLFVVIAIIVEIIFYDVEFFMLLNSSERGKICEKWDENLSRQDEKENLFLFPFFLIKTAMMMKISQRKS